MFCLKRHLSYTLYLESGSLSFRCTFFFRQQPNPNTQRARTCMYSITYVLEYGVSQQRYTLQRLATPTNRRLGDQSKVDDATVKVRAREGCEKTAAKLNQRCLVGFFTLSLTHSLTTMLSSSSSLSLIHI